MRNRCFFKMFAALAFMLSSASVSAQAALTEDTGFGTNPGNLRMFYYVPSGLPADAPLVVVAPGCGQTAQEMADATGWTTLAWRDKFALVFPQTSTANEPTGGCFRTWMPEHQARDAGEPLSVRQMIERMRALYPLSTTRTYITGMSSGGHLTNVMLATYPDVFAAGAPQSSFPYKCAMAFSELSICAQAGRNYTALQWGNLARSGYPGYSGPRPQVQIWHGSLDPLIYLPNQYQQVMQWTNVHGIDAVVDWSDYLLFHVRNSYKTIAGTTKVQTITVQNMGHYIAVDPGLGPQQCGAISAYSADFNICSAYWIGRFFDVVD
ncbi:extracellular catalytic domain type 1 short-chain-length polyhydroxyalkanoate depolymerase [Lysobacter niastensis]|uniref:PHB depolymerase family esterase n=1 Tax=Lysobacter niastensis TaxID=380629 RepID=A0ABS0B9Z5_9GAMM|nr:PHB depolymerase family esterase [Lysobacter niastensis]MBF6023955.1 PHB depolymerase family esterase [Lysobacter niastensis]